LGLSDRMCKKYRNFLYTGKDVYNFSPPYNVKSDQSVQDIENRQLGNDSLLGGFRDAGYLDQKLNGIRDIWGKYLSQIKRDIG